MALRIFEQNKGTNIMQEKLTAIFEKSPQGYIGYIEELPGTNTQGVTLEETRINLIEAIQLVIEANRQLAEEDISGKEIIRQQLGTITV
jgi:predicted RNase H-like HicB family nuclease